MSFKQSPCISAPWLLFWLQSALFVSTWWDTMQFFSVSQIYFFSVPVPSVSLHRLQFSHSNKTAFWSRAIHSHRRLQGAGMSFMTPVSPAMPVMHSLVPRQGLNKYLWNWIETFRTASMNQMNAEHITGNYGWTLTPISEFSLYIEIHMFLQPAGRHHLSCVELFPGSESGLAWWILLASPWWLPGTPLHSTHKMPEAVSRPATRPTCIELFLKQLSGGCWP